MSERHDRGEILEVLRSEETAVVATQSGEGEIRTRKMHYTVNDNFTIYLASIKGDPKTVQITYHPMISLLVETRPDKLTRSSEVEISGRAMRVNENAERLEAFNNLKKVSPVVKHLVEAGNADLLDVIKVVPTQIKYRIFTEITQGIPPTVLRFQVQEVGGSPSELSLLWKKLKVWWLEFRPSFLIATVIPILLGAVIAWHDTGLLFWSYLLLTLLGGLFLHMGTNMINDYYDHKSRNDEINRGFVRPFSGGSRMIQLGLLKPLEVFSASLFCFSAGIAIGLYLAYLRGTMILVLGLIGTISGFFYTAPPFKFANRGVGELLVGLNFGALMTLGSYFVQAQKLAREPLFAGAIMMFMITAVIYINQFPDYDADKEVGKKNLVVRLGLKRATFGYLAIMIAPYITILFGISSGMMSPYAALGLLSLPLALKGIKYAFLYYENSFELVPSNASTIMVHLLTGALLMAGYIVEKMGLRGLFGVLPLGSIMGLLVFWLHHHIENQKRAFSELRASVST